MAPRFPPPHSVRSFNSILKPPQYLRSFTTTPIHLNEITPTQKPHPPPADFGEPVPTTDPLTPQKKLGTNQHVPIADELDEYLRSLVWQFRAPVRYAFAYGSGVFSQGAAASRAAGKKPMVDLMFGVTYTQHWHSLNLGQHRDHYSLLGALGSGAVSYVQDNMGTGVYFNPYVEINGTLIKYGVTNVTTLTRDLTTWDTLYLAGRHQKPVKILRDDPLIRLANESNLISAARVALLLLPDRFTEYDLYSTIAGISYMGDLRMSFAENPNKVGNIVDNQLSHFRNLYGAVLEKLPNVVWVKGGGGVWSKAAKDTWLVQSMDPAKRANMVRRLPKCFRERLYFQYQRKFAIPALEFEKMVNLSEDDERLSMKQGGEFERRIVEGGTEEMAEKVRGVIRSTVGWSSTTQSIKGLLTAGMGRSTRYIAEKVGKWRRGGRGKGEGEGGGGG